MSLQSCAKTIRTYQLGLSCERALVDVGERSIQRLAIGAEQYFSSQRIAFH
jgi:hypothetical protein